ncbi:MAG: hypothetical protein K0R10_2077, partial [Alphaproteobacteria bacterium]|nr:hypothetical protein [Alphaproteobacteria bacterium]
MPFALKDYMAIATDKLSAANIENPETDIRL